MLSESQSVQQIDKMNDDLSRILKEMVAASARFYLEICLKNREKP
jgi:hypothetical protein